MPHIIIPKVRKLHQPTMSSFSTAKPDLGLNRVKDHNIFIISQLWLTSHPRNIVVLLDTETPGTSKEIYSEDANDETQTHNP